MNFEQKAKAANSKAEIDSLINSLPFGIEQDCEGTPEQCLLSGWVNAMDMLDSGEIEDESDFVRFAKSALENMYGI